MILAHEDTAKGSDVVVLVHAFPLDRRMWSAQLDALRAANARAIAVDLRGFGASRSMPAPRTIEEHADDVAETMRSLGVERAIVVGLSMGGYVALALAARHPTLLAGLMLADTKATADSDEAKTGRAANVERARTRGSEAVFEAMRPKVTGARTNASTIERLRAMAREQPVEGVVAALEAMRDRPDRTSELASIHVPTRIVVGSDDTVTPLSDARSMADRIAASKLVVVEGAGHFTNLDDPTTFHRTLDELVRVVRG